MSLAQPNRVRRSAPSSATSRGASKRVAILRVVGAVAGIVVLGAGCVPSLQQNPPREPHLETPAQFRDDAPASEVASVAQQSWNTFFSDPDLAALIEVALQNNQELAIRVQEIIIAQSEVMGRKGEYLPSVSAGVGAGIGKVGDRTSQGRSDEAHGVPKNLANYGFGLSASWEVDIWKKLRNAAKAANFRYLASIEGRNFLVTEVVAEIARSYYELLALDNQLDVLEVNIGIQQDALEVVKAQKVSARATELAVQRFQAEVLKNQSRKFELWQQRVQAENRINFLLGRYPQSIARDASKFDEPLPESIEVGLPSALLDNRPDVRAAAMALEAAKLDVRSAKAAFYPSLSIDASVGFESFNLKHLVKTPEALAYDIAGGLVAPLLNRQGIKAQYFRANAQQLQAVFDYERTLLKAFTEVANSLAQINNLYKAYDLQSQQVDTLIRAVEVSNVLFQSARADYMEVLLTRRDSLDAQMELIDTRNRQRRALVGVYQALGGGWVRQPATEGGEAGDANAVEASAGGEVPSAPAAAGEAPRP